MRVLTTQKQLRKTKHVEGVFFKCHQCKQVKPVKTTGGTGYAYGHDDDRPVCYDCCGENDRKEMIEVGKIVLYLSCEPARKLKEGRKTAGEVTNWPGTLRFKCHTSAGRHNIAGYRYDCWFTGPDGKQWHGVTYGDNTQLCHCRRLKG